MHGDPSLSEINLSLIDCIMLLLTFQRQQKRPSKNQMVDKEKKVFRVQETCLCQLPFTWFSCYFHTSIIFFLNWISRVQHYVRH